MKPRRPGRPPVAADDDSVRVSVTLSVKQVDALCRQALREDVSVAEVIRRELSGINAAKTLKR
jgi:hypothetical protein